MGYCKEHSVGEGGNPLNPKYTPVRIRSYLAPRLGESEALESVSAKSIRDTDRFMLLIIIALVKQLDYADI